MEASLASRLYCVGNIPIAACCCPKLSFRAASKTKLRAYSKDFAGTYSR